MNKATSSPASPGATRAGRHPGVPFMESADGPVTFDMNGWPEELWKATWRFDAETGSIKMLMAQATLSM